VALLGTEEQDLGTPRRTFVAELTRAADVGLLYEVIIGTPWWIPANESPADRYSGWTAQHRSTANVVYADGHVSALRHHGDVNQEGLATDATAWSVPVRDDANDRSGELIWSRAQLGLNPMK